MLNLSPFFGSYITHKNIVFIFLSKRYYLSERLLILKTRPGTLHAMAKDDNWLH